MKVSLNDTAFSTTLDVITSGDSISSTPIYVRLTPGLSVGDYY